MAKGGANWIRTERVVDAVLYHYFWRSDKFAKPGPPAEPFVRARMMRNITGRLPETDAEFSYDAGQTVLVDRQMAKNWFAAGQAEPTETSDYEWMLRDAGVMRRVRGLSPVFVTPM